MPDILYSPTGLNRLVVPGMYGFKWVSGVDEINVTTNNVLGNYESTGYPDIDMVPDYGPIQPLVPPLQTFNVTYANRTFGVDSFTNASMTNVVFDPSQKKMDVSMTVLNGTSSFVDFILEQDFLKGPYNVTVDEKPTSAIEADTNGTSYLYITLAEGFHTVSISGTEFFGHIPEISLYYQASTYVGKSVTFDASKSVDIGTIVSYDWSFGDGSYMNGTTPVVSHSYDKQGIYQVELEVTNNEGLSSFKTVTITVTIPPGNIFFILIVILATMFKFTCLLREREGCGYHSIILVLGA
ncbi:MAG: PKD domain-containing protein [Nitrososphaeria archaeon]